MCFNDGRIAHQAGFRGVVKDLLGQPIEFLVRYERSSLVGWLKHTSVPVEERLAMVSIFLEMYPIPDSISASKREYAWPLHRRLGTPQAECCTQNL